MKLFYIDQIACTIDFFFGVSNSLVTGQLVDAMIENRLYCILQGEILIFASCIFLYNSYTRRNARTALVISSSTSERGIVNSKKIHNLQVEALETVQPAQIQLLLLLLLLFYAKVRIQQIILLYWLSWCCIVLTGTAGCGTGLFFT